MCDRWTVNTGIVALVIILIGATAAAANPVADIAANPVTLVAGSGPAGGAARVELGLAQAGDVQGFNLLLEFAPGQMLAGAADGFTRNGAYFPVAKLGQHSLNAARDAGPGRIRIVGLAPNAAAGPVKVGSQGLRIAAGASVGATQRVTVSGEVNVGGVITAIAPVSALVTVADYDEKVYLPLIQRR